MTSFASWRFPDFLFCDFSYMPSSFGSRRGKGYAFVNFNSPQAAEIFVRAWRKNWHNSRRFGVAANVTLNVSAAVVQGRDSNVNRWNSAKMARVKNANRRPYVPGVNNVPDLPPPRTIPLPKNSRSGIIIGANFRSRPSAAWPAPMPVP